MKNLRKSCLIYTYTFCSVAAINAQTSVNGTFFNEGTISVASTGVISTLYDFDNRENAKANNDGIIYYYNNFNNNGTYTYSSNQKTSKAVFTPHESNQGMQVISGDALTDFYNIDLNNNTPNKAFDLKANIDVYGTVDFQNGIIRVDSLENKNTGFTNGMLSFQKGANAINVSDKSHAEGQVEKIGNEVFQYPKGDKGMYRYARISAPKSEKDVFSGQYITGDHQFFRSRPTTAGIIKLLDINEYWLIDRGSNVKSDILITLSWDKRTTPAELLVNPEQDLHIVRWDAAQQLWVDEGGVVDISTNEITTVSTVKGYGFFTLATVKKDWMLEGDIVIYNLVTPNGDGKNDYFHIENINKYPNNTVEIYNRWGVKVYETKGYDTNGDGSTNVFRGYSDGRVTVDKNKILPSGTYYYVLTYEYTDNNGSRIVKKAANLHLDTN